MPVVLTPQLEAKIQEQIDSGRYLDAGEVIVEALRLLEERNRVERIRASVAEGFAQVERGEYAVYTPELRERIDQSAIPRAKAGERPHPDVIPSDHVS